MSPVPARVRPLQPGDVAEAVRLHQAQLSEQFVTAFGPRFLAHYYRAFADSPAGLALVAVDPEDGRVIGTLLGSTDPRRHYEHLVRRHGLVLAVTMLAAALTRPRLGWSLLRSRGVRYLRGMVRLLARRVRPAAASAPAPGSGAGEITAVLVDPAARGRGAGGELVRAAVRHAEQAGAGRMELVTLPDPQGAGEFYRKLGWSPAGSLTSRSGERFDRYELVLGT